MKFSERLAVWLKTTLLFFAAYFATNRFSFSEPSILPMTVVDDWIGFRPTWIWIYVLTYVLVVSPYIGFDRERLKSFNQKFFVISVVTFLIFIFYPTTMDRTPYVPQDLDAWTAGLLSFLQGVDQPTNCIPSLHVSISLLVCLSWHRQLRSLVICSLLWMAFVAICISTIATKQHYFLDVIGGIAVGWLGSLSLQPSPRRLQVS